ncbi:MAG: glycosyltransferase [Bacteroidaceae bacterium]|nr:glycosyltransferase [Bacteroidaceae bacterium]
MQHLRISIITVAYNSAATLEDTIQSVLSQTYPDIEYIVVDGDSTDGTAALLRRYESRFQGRLLWVSEKDNGIYDAMNKGFRMATGDVVGILNSDDYFTAPDVIARMAEAFADEAVDAVYGDIHFIRDGEPERCVRYYSSRRFSPGWLRFGFMPAHPSFYARRAVFERAGLYKTDYKIGSDYEMMVRLFCVHRIRARYLPMDFVTMRMGGLSTSGVHSKLQLIKDDVRACRENGIYTNALFIATKFLFKIFELRG